jgi:hypothetical protein
MRRCRFALVLIATTLWPTGGQSLDQNGKFLAIGAGLNSCGHWTKVRAEGGDSIVDENWIQGFISSHNHYAFGPNDLGMGMKLDALGPGSTITVRSTLMLYSSLPQKPLSLNLSNGALPKGSPIVKEEAVRLKLRSAQEKSFGSTRGCSTTSTMAISTMSPARSKARETRAAAN